VSKRRRAAPSGIPTWQERCETHPDHNGIITHWMIQDRMQEEIDDLRAALAEQEAEPVAYRATSITGDTAHFGVASAARAWARGGTVEAVPLKHLRLVPKHSERGPDCRDLLDALRGIVALWDHHASAHGDGIIYPLHQAARAAITKATGEGA